jgi:hypothetical protein
VADVGFSSPEEAALDGWRRTPGAQPFVTSVALRGERAEVVLRHAEQGYTEWVYCVRRNKLWHERASGNGPTIGWDDPDKLEW